MMEIRIENLESLLCRVAFRVKPLKLLKSLITGFLSSASKVRDSSKITPFDSPYF